MAKKSSTWLSPKKQRELEEKLKREKSKKIIKYVILGIAAAALIACLAVWIAMSARPYYADIEIEGYGTVTIKLNDSEAPLTVDHFVSLAENGFYDGTTIPNVLKNNMLCGGYKPKGALPEAIKGEFSKNGYENNLSHVRGTISMLRRSPSDGGNGDKAEDYYDTATNEFFIMQRDNLKFDGEYAAFGTVISGMEIIDKICSEVEASESGAVSAENQPVIKSVIIRRSN